MIASGKESLIYKDRAIIEKKYSKTKKRNFRSKIDPKNGMENHKFFYAFIFGGIFGTVYEDFLILFMKGIFELHSGVFWLPFNPLYGFGCLAFVWVLSQFDNWYDKITYGAILGGTVEYFASLFQEIFTNSTSWNYTGKLTSIDGRTTVIFAIGWGIMGYAVYTFVWPLIIKFVRLVPFYLGEKYTKFFKIFIILVMIISYAALIRCNLKMQGMEPITIFGVWLDKLFPPSFVKIFFVNMKFK